MRYLKLEEKIDRAIMKKIIEIIDGEISPEMLALLEKWDPILNPNNLNRTPLSELVLIESEEQVCIENLNNK